MIFRTATARERPGLTLVTRGVEWRAWIILGVWINPYSPLTPQREYPRRPSPQQERGKFLRLQSCTVSYSLFVSAVAPLREFL